MSGRPVQSDLHRHDLIFLNGWLPLLIRGCSAASDDLFQQSRSVWIWRSHSQTDGPPPPPITPPPSSPAQTVTRARCVSVEDTGENQIREGTRVKTEKKKEQLEEWKVEKRLDSIDERRLDKTRLEGKRWRKQRGETRLEARREEGINTEEWWGGRRMEEEKTDSRQRVLERLEGREGREGNPRVSELLEWKIRACFYQILGYKFSLCGPVESEQKTLW